MAYTMFTLPHARVTKGSRVVGPIGKALSAELLVCETGVPVSTHRHTHTPWAKCQACVNGIAFDSAAFISMAVDIPKLSKADLIC